MFWDAVLKGIGVLAFWQFWVVAAVMLVTHILWFMTPMMIKKPGAKVGPALALLGCLLDMAASCFAILALMPILVNGDSFMPWAAFQQLALKALWVGGLAYVAVFLLGLIPFVGFFSNIFPGLSGFAAGVATFRLVFEDFLKKTHVSRLLEGSVYPGIWEVLGFLMVALLLSVLCLVPLRLWGEGKGKDFESALDALTPALFRILFLLPVFMYAGYSALRVLNVAGG